MSGIYRNVEFPIAGKEEIIIGRDSNLAHIIVKDGSVSRKHCGICFDKGNNCYYVRGTILAMGHTMAATGLSLLRHGLNTIPEP